MNGSAAPSSSSCASRSKEPWVQPARPKKSRAKEQGKMRPLDLLGTGIVLSWLALPLLARAARPMTEQHPAGAYRRILAALLLSAVCLALPWLRTQLPSSTSPLTPLALTVQVLATPVGGQQFGAMRGFAASPFDLLAIIWGIACTLSWVRWGVARLRLTLLLARAVPASTEQQQVLA